MGFLNKLFGGGSAANEIDVATTLASSRDSNVQIIDCRERYEWKSGHIAGSKLIPVGSIGKRMNELDKDRPVIVLCHSGHRSGRVARQLTNAGFADVKSMKGGISAWNRAGYDLVS